MVLQELHLGFAASPELELGTASACPDSLYHAVLRKCFKDFCHLIAKPRAEGFAVPESQG